MPTNYFFADATPLDDGQPYYVDMLASSWGSPPRRPPVVTPTYGGNYTVYPLPTAFAERRGRLRVFARGTSYPDKQRALGELVGVLSGEVQLHKAGRYLDVSFLQAPEDEATQGLGKGFAVLAEWIAPVPFWRLNQPLRGLAAPVNIGDEWELYDEDGSLPDPLPEYVFTTAEFVFTNWGTAFCYGAGTVTAGPPDTTIYLSGLGESRVAVALDASGNGAFAESDEFYLAAGDSNSIRVEDAAGDLVDLTSLASFELAFGETYMRFF